MLVNEMGRSSILAQVQTTGRLCVESLILIPANWTCLHCPNYIVEASVPMIILFCVIRKDVDNLYKWQMLQTKSLHQKGPKAFLLDI